MGFLRRLRGGEPAPDWASFFTPDAYRAFIDVVRADLDRRGATYEIGDGIVRMTGTPGELGLVNLAQVCNTVSQNDWPVVVAAHFDNLASRSGRDLDGLAADFDQVRSILRVRLLADESMGGMTPDDIAGSRRYAPGILLTLVYDFPDSTQSVASEHLESWPLDADAVWQIAIDNVRLEPQPVRQTVPAQGGAFELATGDDFYVASRVLRLVDLLPAGTIDAVVAVPNRHVLLWHVIHDASVVGAMQGMAAVAARMFSEGPGSISNQLYWWRTDAIVHLPIRVRDKATDFFPPDEFVARLNELPAP
jgi:hypothetical protein